MTGEHDTRNNNQMKDDSQQRTSPEDGLLLGHKKILHVSWETVLFTYPQHVRGPGVA
jgi:hypothetical protein